MGTFRNVTVNLFYIIYNQILIFNKKGGFGCCQCQLLSLNMTRLIHFNSEAIHSDIPVHTVPGTSCISLKYSIIKNMPANSSLSLLLLLIYL